MGCDSLLGRDPLLGRGHLLLGRQNLYFSIIIAINGSPNNVLFLFVGRQPKAVENHRFRECSFMTSHHSNRIDDQDLIIGGSVKLKN